MRVNGKALRQFVPKCEIPSPILAQPRRFIWGAELNEILDYSMGGLLPSASVTDRRALTRITRRGTNRLSVPVAAGLCRISDIGCLVAASLVTGFFARQFDPGFRPNEFTLLCLIALGVTKLWLSQGRVYCRPALLAPWRFAPQFVTAVLIGGLAHGASRMVLHAADGAIGDGVRPALGWMCVAWAALLAGRTGVAMWLRMAARRGLFATSVAIVGATRFGRALSAGLTRDQGFTIHGVFDDRLSRVDDGPVGMPVIGTSDDLIALSRIDPPDAIVIALPLSAADRIAELRSQLSGIAADIYVTPDIAGLRYASADFTGLGNCPVISVSPNPLRDWAAVKKSVFDRIASAVLLFLLTPLLCVLAIAIRFDSPGPVLFRQQREGLNGTTFTLLKFRSMRHRWQNDDESVQATRGDKRVTRLGRWLRRTSLDELPQLYNVLRGDMSLVGPRPHLPVTRIGGQTFRDAVPRYHARHRMKPGITGWAQVHGLRGETVTTRDLIDRVSHDLHYIDNWSLILDIKILVGTVFREIFSVSGKAY